MISIRLAVPALILVAGLFSVSCTRQAAPDRPGVEVVASFHAMKLLVEPLVGDAGTVRTLLPPGSSPHAYEPRPSDIQALQSARLIVRAGSGVDDWIAGIAERPTVSLRDLVPDSLLIRGETDPHVWLDPLAVAAAVPGLAEALCEADPSGCAGYRERATDFADGLPGLVERIRAALAGIRDSSVVTSGPFFAWWSRRFGPGVLATVEQSEGVEPSASRMRTLIEAARRASAVVGQATLPDQAARAVAEAAGIPYVVVDAVGSETSAPDYERLLYSIAEALSGP